MWRQVITAKVRNQAARSQPSQASQHAAYGHCRSLPGQTNNARRGRIARGEEYWRQLLPRLSNTETHREPGTRKGVNGMLDYGYAVVRTAVLRSLAAHGFIAALGIAHTAKAGSFALADDLMEPLRPWLDRELFKHIEKGNEAGKMDDWIPMAAGLLAKEVPMNKTKVRFLPAIDLYVESFATATVARAPLPLRIPMLV
jgi:CRISP-associated protein Cas1